MKFLAQTRNGKIIHDFVFALNEAMYYQEVLAGFMSQDKPILVRHDGCDFSGIDNLDDYTPVGSIDFVSAFLRTFYPKAENMLRPLNVPEELFPYAGREIANVICKDDFKPFWKYNEVYAKSIDEIKDQFNGLYDDIHGKNVAKDFRHCQVSEVIQIVSEWRVFVFQGQILDCRNYSGHFFVYPDPDRIIKMVKAYEPAAPAAYTLDVAVTTKGETVIIECHRFFSCGLYGFKDHKLLPYMFSQTWFQMKNNIGK